MDSTDTGLAQDKLISPVRLRQQWAAEALALAHRQGGLTLVIDGVAGMGKTFFLRELTAAALNDGRWHVTVVRADPYEVGEPYSFIERIVAASQVEDWYFEPGKLTNPIPVARECIRRLTGGNTAPGRVFVVDDAQWIDAESHRVLRYVIPRITRRKMLLAIGARSPHEPGSFGEFLKNLVDGSHLDRWLHMEPLSAQAVTALVAERYGVAIPTAAAAQIVDQTTGSFLEVDSILASLTEEDVSQLRFGWKLPIDRGAASKNPLLSQFEELDAPARATVELVSLVDYGLSTEQIVAAAAIVGEPVHLDEAIAAGVLVRSTHDATISPRHALLASAITESLSRERMHTLHDALSQVKAGYRALRHRVKSVDRWNDTLQDEVRDFVENAVAQGKFGVASELLRVSLSLDMEREERIALIESLVLVNLQAKTGYLVLDLADEIAQFPPTLLQQMMMSVLTAHRVGREISRDAVRDMLMSTPKDADERAILAFYSFMVAMLSMRTADVSVVPATIDVAKKLIAAGPKTPAELTDQRLSWLVAPEALDVVLDCYLMVQEQQHARMAKVAELLPGLIRRIDELEDSPHKVDAIVAVAGAQLAVGQAAQARAMVEYGVTLLERVGEPWAAGTARVILGHCLVLYGELDAATELMELAEEVTYGSLDVETRSSWLSLRLAIGATVGDEHAHLYIEPSRQHQALPWQAFGPEFGVIAECELGRARGDHEAVLRATEGEWVATLHNTQRGFLTFRAHALIDTGRAPEAAELIAELSQSRGVRWQEYWGTLDWLQARLAQAQQDAQTARWHYEAAIQYREFPLPLGLTLADYGRFLSQHGDAVGGREALLEAVSVLEGIGADGYLAQVRPLLEGGDALTPAPGTDTQLARLTERERQIVQHLAKGRSNNQIAESFVVSVATVRSHISNILRKLGLSSRGEVARLVRESSQDGAE